MHSNFHSQLLSWFQSNQRDLPWRINRNPYSIWLSEIILQQTRIDQGTAYYFRFMEAYPDVHQLAEASEDQVLRLWQGLGYYSRARNLHKTAKIVSQTFNGVFPNTSIELQKLPGIGPYTAAAISSIAFDYPVAAVDGNVIRVIARYNGVQQAVDMPEGLKKIRDYAQASLFHRNPGMHNQAMMELGALICSPQNPKCLQCPISEGCYALQNNLIDEIPLKQSKTKVRNRFLTYFIPVNKNQLTLIQRRNQSDIWQGLFEFPLIEDGDAFEPLHQLKFVATLPIKENRIKITHVSPQVTHVLSHQKLHARFIHAEAEFELPIEHPWKLIHLDDLSQFGMPRLITRYWEKFQ